MPLRRIHAGALALVLAATACGRKPGSIDVAPKKVKIFGIERSQRLTARILDKKGGAFDSGAPSWTSSNPAVAQVEAGGRVVAKKAGKAMITASLASRRCQSRWTYGASTSHRRRASRGPAGRPCRYPTPCGTRAEPRATSSSGPRPTRSHHRRPQGVAPSGRATRTSWRASGRQGPGVVVDVRPIAGRATSTGWGATSRRFRALRQSDGIAIPKWPRSTPRRIPGGDRGLFRHGFLSQAERRRRIELPAQGRGHATGDSPRRNARPGYDRTVRVRRPSARILLRRAAPTASERKSGAPARQGPASPDLPPAAQSCPTPGRVLGARGRGRVRARSGAQNLRHYPCAPSRALPGAGALAWIRRTRGARARGRAGRPPAARRPAGLAPSLEEDPAAHERASPRGAAAVPAGHAPRRRVRAGIMGGAAGACAGKWERSRRSPPKSRASDPRVLRRPTTTRPGVGSGKTTGALARVRSVDPGPFRTVLTESIRCGFSPSPRCSAARAAARVTSSVVARRDSV